MATQGSAQLRQRVRSDNLTGYLLISPLSHNKEVSFLLDKNKVATATKDALQKFLDTQAKSTASQQPNQSASKGQSQSGQNGQQSGQHGQSSGGNH